MTTKMALVVVVILFYIFIRPWPNSFRRFLMSKDMKNVRSVLSYTNLLNTMVLHWEGLAIDLDTA